MTKQDFMNLRLNDSVIIDGICYKLVQLVDATHHEFESPMGKRITLYWTDNGQGNGPRIVDRVVPTINIDPQTIRIKKFDETDNVAA